MKPEETQGPVVNIRKREKEKIAAHLLPGHILQICGPPMTGKATLTEQVLSNSWSSSHCILSHGFTCENLDSFHDVLTSIAIALGLTSVTASPVNEKLILSLLKSSLARFSDAHHVLVFYKCEGLQSKQDGQEFLNFLWWITHKLSQMFAVSVVITSSKHLPLTGKNTSTVEISVLDWRDVDVMLNHYAPDVVNLSSYVDICMNYLPFPAAVRLFAEKFLTNHEMNRDSAYVLGEKIANDEQFWCELLESKVSMVEKWIPQDVLNGILMFCQSFGSSFSKEHFKFVVEGYTRIPWVRLNKYLTRNYIILMLPYRLLVHPLVIYHVLQCRRLNRLELQGQWYDHSRNRYTDFLCRFLRNTEENMEKHGKKGMVYGCLVQEWPHIRHMIEMALSCNENTYKAFLKAAVSARGVIIRCFNTEAYPMYLALYECAKIYGTPSEVAMVEAIVGHLKASTVVLAKGGTWQEAEDFLDSAIKTLRQEGPPFALMWAIYRKGIILTRQAKYKEAQVCFKNAKRVTVVEADDSDLEETFGVSKLQVKEEKLTRDIYSANAFIFLGDNDLAEEILLACREDIKNEYADHPELITLLNSLGLIAQRGHGDIIKALEFYIESYEERKCLVKINKELLIVSLNNIAMIYLKLGKLADCKKYLKEALDIRRDLGWVHANTALTLTHLGFVNYKCGEIAEAFKQTLEADSILQKIIKDHDTRRRINNTLGHLLQLLGMRNEINLLVQSEDLKWKQSAEEYFEYTLELANRTIGNCSDDGYHHLLLAHEHLMLLALGNSKEKYEQYKSLILPYFEVREGIGKKVFNANERIPKHVDLYKYYSTTAYEDIDKTIFLHHLTTACEYCDIARSLCTVEEMWFGKVQSKADSEIDVQLQVSMLEPSNSLASSLAKETVDVTENDVDDFEMHSDDPGSIYGNHDQNSEQPSRSRSSSSDSDNDNQIHMVAFPYNPPTIVVNRQQILWKENTYPAANSNDCTNQHRQQSLQQEENPSASRNSTRNPQQFLASDNHTFFLDNNRFHKTRSMKNYTENNNQITEELDDEDDDDISHTVERIDTLHINERRQYLQQSTAKKSETFNNNFADQKPMSQEVNKNRKLRNKNDSKYNNSQLNVNDKANQNYH